MVTHELSRRAKNMLGVVEVDGNNFDVFVVENGGEELQSLERNRALKEELCLTFLLLALRFFPLVFGFSYTGRPCPLFIDKLIKF